MINYFWYLIAFSLWKPTCKIQHTCWQYKACGVPWPVLPLIFKEILSSKGEHSSSAQVNIFIFKYQQRCLKRYFHWQYHLTNHLISWLIYVFILQALMFMLHILTWIDLTKCPSTDCFSWLECKWLTSTCQNMPRLLTYEKIAISLLHSVYKQHLRHNSIQ